MSKGSWWRRWLNLFEPNSGGQAKPRHIRGRSRRLRCRPWLEVLEDRLAPALFGAATNFAAGPSPRAVAVGDFTGNGHADLVVATVNAQAVNNNPDSVSVLLGDGAGGFGAPTTFSIGAGGPLSVAVGDLTGNGHLDIVTANLAFDTVSVLLGDGHGGFGAPTLFAVGHQPFSVAVGDFNGDGHLDIVTANRGDPTTVSVLLGDGHGGFAAATNIDIAGRPVSVAVGDFNGDGHLDIATANLVSNDVSVLLGDGHGGFAAPTYFPVGNYPDSIAVADFNGDGHLDIVTTNNQSLSLSVLLGDGHGGFAAATTLSGVPFSDDPTAVTVGDFNGDGHVDLAVANYSWNTVSVWLGDGAGGFAAPVRFGVGTNPDAVAVGDFNGHGKADLVTANVASNNVSVLLSTSTATLPTVQFSVVGETLDETAGTFTITVTLSAASGTPTSVPFTLGGSAVAGTDYNGVTASPLVIGAGSTSGVITGNLVDDGLYGGSFDKTLIVTLGAPTGATLGLPSTNTLTLSEISARPSFPGLTAQERYVQALYLDELGRPGSKAELDAWVAVLNGPGGAAAVVAGIKGSSEATDHLVKSWYQLFLGRPALGGEELGWAKSLQLGQPEEVVLSQILGSPEFYSHAQTLVAVGSADQRYVQALYQLLLHRTASPAEVDGWVNKMPPLSRQGVALNFLTSAEFRINLIEGYYNGLLHRPSDAAGLNAWVLSGLDATTVRGDFETGPEFFTNG